MKFKVNILLFLVISGMITSCNPGKNRSTEEKFIIPDSIDDVSFQIHEEAMAEVIGNLASPVEIAAMLNDLGIPFNGNLTATTDKVKELESGFDKALALGAYGADLGYLNIYSRNTQIVDYISAIKYLTDELNVGQFFDFKTLKSLCESKHNMDSLMFVSVHSFNQMNSFLERTGNGKTSALVVTGLWLEGFYIATQIDKNNSQKELIESIGEQKIILSDLLTLLENFTGNPEFGKLIQDLGKLAEIYEGVEISYETGEPETIENDEGMLEIIQNEKSIVHTTDEQIERIRQETYLIRNHFINL